jgi:RNA polymerase sigma-70 factor (ECF subfamily)
MNYLNTTGTSNRHEEKSADASLDRQYFQERLRSGLAQLSDEQRAAFLLRFQEELTIPQISAIMDCPVGTVKSRLFYACEKLSHLLEEFDPKGEG